ncbi:MAG: hypothetical protein JSW07_08590, partial [bacterium]
MIKKLILFNFLLIFLCLNPVKAEDEVCMDCHSDPTLTAEKDGKIIPMFIKGKEFKNSVHGENGCISCHHDIDEEDLPHDFPLKKVECQNCHDSEAKQHDESLHGIAFQKGDSFAPTCVSCHGSHYIIPPSNPKSLTYVMNIPIMCGRCHKEGSAMVKVHDIPERDIIQNYSMSIHGEGLFKRGLTVTAVCTNCHTAHHILPHTDPRSSINRNNIAGMCTQCHAQIETVHLKVIRGELWEKQPHIIPACIDCHSPHKIRRVFYTDTMSDNFCMNCHSNRNLVRQHDDQVDSLFVNLESISNSVHGNQIECVKCHVNVSHLKTPVCKNSGPVDCSMCHPEVASNYQMSTHGKLLSEGDPNAPECRDCHGTHFIQSKNDLNSPIFTRNIPQLCGQCHREGEKAAVRYTGPEKDIVK